LKRENFQIRPPTLELRHNDFFRALFDALEDQLAVIDCEGVIVYVNAAWIRFGLENGSPEDTAWVGRNYLDVCSMSANDQYAACVSAGIEKIISSAPGMSIAVEYPCYGSRIKHWFLMRATKMSTDAGPFVVVVHSDITRRKLAEQRAQRQAVQDPLTGLANRRAFDSHLHTSWLQCRRDLRPLSLLSIDIDHFKILNDTIGHPAADVCLKSVSHVIRHFARRPEDLAARIGGEEFSMILPDTPIKAALRIAESLRLAIASADVLTDGYTRITASIGVVSVIPQNDMSMESLLSAADVALYAAKHKGRNCVMVGVADGKPD
jgi:diguanylate cyclase (GGDEF)-like protein/PAS domain S-box-containing protein